jgi:hypothetical protein
LTDLNLQVKVNIKLGRYNLHHDVEPHFIGNEEISRIQAEAPPEGKALNAKLN